MASREAGVARFFFASSAGVYNADQQHDPHVIEEPLNLGSSELVSIDAAEEIAGVKLTHRYSLGAPEGVNGRNSDHTLIRERLGWEPVDSRRTGLKKTLRLDLRPNR